MWLVLLCAIQCVVVQEEKTGNGFASVWNPLVQTSWICFVRMEVHLIESNNTVLAAYT